MSLGTAQPGGRTAPRRCCDFEKNKNKKRFNYARRDSNSGFPACEAGVITRLDHARTLLQWGFCEVQTHKKYKNKKDHEPRGIRTPNLRVWNPTRCHCAMGSVDTPTVGLEPTTTRLRVLRSTN